MQLKEPKKEKIFYYLVFSSNPDSYIQILIKHM